MLNKLVIGTRKSLLALTQTGMVRDMIMQAHPGIEVELQHIITTGDKNVAQALPEIGGKGLFTAELEEALRKGEIDIAVHSLKDLPTAEQDEFEIGAIPERESVHDVLVSRDNIKLQDLPPGAIVGSSSLRRIVQLKLIRADLRFESIRGNVDTRIGKIRGPSATYHAAVFAEAGLNRLARATEITQRFTFDEMLPAPGQGALAIQCRRNDSRIAALLKPLDHLPTRQAVTAERAFLATLQAGCSAPVGAYAWHDQGRLHLRTFFSQPIGSQPVRSQDSAAPERGWELGEQLARELLNGMNP